MSKSTSISQPEDVLRNTAITEKEPGTILHDFQVMLDFVAEYGAALTNAHMLPMKALIPLNERLARPIEHGLTRPQQKSYPHINGLFLLLRASGLTWVDATGRKPILVIDPIVEASWRSLNPNEQYFTLLESWIMRGDGEIIGAGRGFTGLQSPLYLWADFHQRLERQDWYDSTWNERVRYWPGLHNLALMDLFGFVTIEDAPAEPKMPWQIEDVRTTKWGDSMLTLLYSELSDDEEFWDKLYHPQDTQPGELQPLIQPYRPNWQQTLHLPDIGFKEGLFVFKVSLDKDLWRQITLPAQSTLEDLSDAILSAYRFDHDHLYRFLYPTRFGLKTEVIHPEMTRNDSAYTTEVRIGDLPAQPGFTMVYNFDFGDNWLFDILLERIDPPDLKAKPYKIGKRVGKSPEQYPDGDWGYIILNLPLTGT